MSKNLYFSSLNAFSYMNRLGINVGEVNITVHAVNVKGMKYFIIFVINQVIFWILSQKKSKFHSLCLIK